MRGVEQLAENQFGRLSFVDGPIAAGTVPDHFNLWRFWFGFEQQLLLVYPMQGAAREVSTLPFDVDWHGRPIVE